jgi:hypothetical protein
VSDAPFESLGGWLNDPAKHAETRGELPFPLFGDAARNLQGAGDGKTALLYKAWKDVLGNYPSYKAQEIGDCESMGNGHGVDLTECIQIVIQKKAETYKETCTEALYGMGREAGGMLGGGDGCYGSAMAKALTTMGVIPREKVGAYSGQRAKLWGGRNGVPAEIKALGADHKIKTASMVANYGELESAIASGYVVAVSSNQGFTMQRDSQGFCQARGSWSHCMLICGIRNDERRGACIAQSWGPETPSGPLVLDQPPFSFWADWQTVDRMLGMQDSYALSALVGYPGQPLPSNWTYGDFI